MALDPTTGVPERIEAGNSYSFLLSYSDFPTTGYTLTLVLTQGTAAPVSVVATVSSARFLVTLSTAVTGALAAGECQWVAYASATGVRYTAESGSLLVLPNLAATQTPSFAQAQVTLLKTVLAAFNNTTYQEVEFQGQRFKRYSIFDYQRQLAYWEARVLGEQQERSAAFGGEVKDPCRIASRFASV